MGGIARESLDPASRGARQRRPPGVEREHPAAPGGLLFAGPAVRMWREGGTGLLSAAVLVSLQGHAGNRAVQRLLSGPATAGVAVQRRAMLATSPGVAPHEMTAAERRSFVRLHFPAAQRRLAAKILADMAAAGDSFVFSDEGELRSELVKRVTMSEVMRDSQRAAVSGSGRRAFGYPFTGASLFWGPRVNIAAAGFWAPAVVDGYSTRDDPVKRRTLAHLPRGERHTVFGDPAGNYEWSLTAAGRADPHEAILRLFDRQRPHERTLIHCDYLVSLVEYRAFAAAVGKPAFNAQIAAFGPANIRLKWNAFADLGMLIPATLGHSARPGLGSLIEAHPTSQADLVIGDHVVFFNHTAYDAVNAGVGNAWRLENAVLVDKGPGGNDIFLGHGSGELSAQQLRQKLAAEYNKVVDQAKAVVYRIEHGSAARRASAEAERQVRFPNVTKVGTQWRIIGPSIAGNVNEPLAHIRAGDVIGLRDPWNPGQLFTVRRPSESRP